MTKLILVIALLLATVLLQGTNSSPTKPNWENEMIQDISTESGPPPDEISKEFPTEEEEYNKYEQINEEEKYEDIIGGDKEDNDYKLDFEGKLDDEDNGKKDNSEEELKDTVEEEENTDPETAGGENIIEGDIELTPAQAAAFKEGGYDSLVKSEAWRRNHGVWHRYVPYNITNIEPAERDALMYSIGLIQETTCLRFIQRDVRIHNDYLKFVKPARGGCSSPVGKRGGAQTINLGRRCRGTTPAHEIMHSLGRWHEQSRPDRDTYVTINWANIQTGKAHNFGIHVNADTQRVPYDFTSIMHYSKYAFSKNRQPTIVTKQRGAVIAREDRLSTHDITQLNIRYCPETVIRLVGGRKPHEGRVEVKWNNNWGTVCDDYFGITDGNVTCKYLGYPEATNIYKRAHYGRGSGPIWFDNMHCRGNEYSPFNCTMNAIGSHNCHHREDAGVKCQPNVRLAGTGSSASQGRVEVFVNGQWGTVCDDHFDANEAKVICRQLGYTMGSAHHRALYGPGTLPILLDDLRCTGKEQQLAHCRSRPVGQHNCRHSEDASVRCSN